MRRQLTGPAAITAALDAGEPVRMLLVRGRSLDPQVQQLVDRAKALGIRVHEASDRSLLRLSLSDDADETQNVLGLVGPPADAPLDEVLRAEGAVWLLVGLVYPGNTGFAIRTAEVSGADGIVIDNDFDHAGRREAVRAAMRADRYLPVFWERAGPVIRDARAAGRQIVAIEDVGTRAPWEIDLARPSLFVVGAERHGIPADVIAACDETIRLPMRGFIPSYNLQAAMAMVVGERLRQESSFSP